MTLSINGITIPSNPDVLNNGNYVYQRFGETHDNGLGDVATSGLPSATWKFSTLAKEAWQWWTVTLLAGAPSLRCPAHLPDDNDTEITFTGVVVHYPTYARRSNGYYYDVEVVIDTMET